MAKQSTIEICPKCGGVAKPIAVRNEAGKVLISFICPYCETEWEKVRPEERES
jgi:formate dehydrogenase maturation protein FdhE